MDNQERSWHLLAGKLSGEATEKELEELNDILLSNPDTASIARVITAFWELPAPTDSSAIEQAYTKIAAVCIQKKA